MQDVEQGWVRACARTDVKRHRPLGLVVSGVPLVLVRDRKGRATAFLDRCPHRMLPLSMGTVKGERLICAYHGWQFDPAGNCTHIPSNVEQSPPKQCLKGYPIHEVGPDVWAWLGAGDPVGLPG